MIDPADPDASLMVAFQKGDTKAFEQLLDRYHRGIVNFIYRLVNNRSEAEELAQEVFLRVCRARESYEPRAKFASWIFRIAANAALKTAERSRRSPVRTAGAAGLEDDGAVGWASDPSPDPERRMASRETVAIVRDAIARLPAKERVAVVLRRYNGLSYSEIAEAMDCTEAAVKTYIHRGKIHLRERLLPLVEKGSI
jgi:RNA polymerase sigma-70 factor, ECF subfamily